MRTKKIELKTGVVIVPENFIVIEETKTAKTDYAAVIAEKQGTLPHYVVFLEKPVEEMTVREEETIFETCSKNYPEIKETLNEEIEPTFDEQGRIENIEEWFKSVRIGMFGIPDKKQGEKTFCGTAIYRRA